MAPPRILCIEADPPFRARVRRLLEGQGYAVDEAPSGLAGIQRALTLPPDLVIADVRLPDLDGAEIASRLKQERSLASVPFLALGEADSEHDLALAAGADAFLARPVDDARLVEEVRAVLSGRREHLPDEGERAGLRALKASMSTHLEQALGDARTWEDRCIERDRLGRIFIGNLAHELRTALTPISGYLKILASDKLGPLSAQQRRILESIQGAAGRLTRVVENLSDFSALESADAALFPAEVDPDQLADEVVADLRPAIREARLHVTVQKSGGGPITADPRKLRQALANVVGNAVKFSPHGGEILVEVQRDARAVRFAVSDQGPGIGPARQRHVFEPFFHAADEDDRAKHPGSGLGLPVARRIVEAHGGTIAVESPPRVQSEGVRRVFTGSKFVLEIPVQTPG
ncbi:MAG TPA: hybrid sensor histidine kinase/response regulator [Anaeromyxobacteraceae bacterium]|nr:hybrid sensor histidine kinase/response regulator [Anaeromyxobacteraceae bacterium]